MHLSNMSFASIILLGRLQQWSRLNKNSSESCPQRENPVIGDQMAAKGAVSRIRVAIESDMPDEEMFERPQSFSLPTGRLQDRSEYGLEATVLIRRKADRSCHLIKSANFRQICPSECFEFSVASHQRSESV